MKNPYIVNFFTQRDYERIPEMLEIGSKVVITDPKSYGERKKR